MEELVDLVVKKTGCKGNRTNGCQDRAGFSQEKLPPQVSGTIDSRRQRRWQAANLLGGFMVRKIKQEEIRISTIKQ
jgi:hypothetical protein